MQLAELEGAEKLEEALQQKCGTFLTKLSAEVDSLIINLDDKGCQAVLEQMDQHTPNGEMLVEMKALRSLRVIGSLKRWQQQEQPITRLLQLLRPVALEELTLIGLDQMKVVRTLLADTRLRGTLRRLTLGLHGFHFLAQEDLTAFGAPLEKLRSLNLFGVDTNGSTCRDSFCRMFICAVALLDYLGQIRHPEEVEVLRVANAGVLGDDHQIASLLRCLASFSDLRCLKLPLPSQPLTFREVLSLRLALPHLTFFVAEWDRIEGADSWPEGEDWPPMMQIWPLCETITPLSVFSQEFADLLPSHGQVVAEWARLTPAEQGHWIKAVPIIQQVYRQCEHDCCLGGIAPECIRAADTASTVGDSSSSVVWRATPEVREKIGERSEALAETDEASDLHCASTHGVEDWRAEERVALRGVLAMKASDVCKEKARLRKEPKSSRLSEGVELVPASSSACCRAVQDSRSSSDAAQGIVDSGSQQCCARGEVSAELGGA